VLSGVRLNRRVAWWRQLACRGRVGPAGLERRLLPALPVGCDQGARCSPCRPPAGCRGCCFGPAPILVPREDGLMWWGATSRTEAGFRWAQTAPGQSAAEAGLTPVAGGRPAGRPMERWWGFRPARPNQCSLLGPVPIEGLWLATALPNGVALCSRVTAGAVTARVSGDRRDDRRPSGRKAFCRPHCSFCWPFASTLLLFSRKLLRPPGDQTDGGRQSLSSRALNQRRFCKNQRFQGRSSGSRCRPMFTARCRGRGGLRLQRLWWRRVKLWRHWRSHMAFPRHPANTGPL